MRAAREEASAGTARKNALDEVHRLGAEAPCLPRRSPAISRSGAGRRAGS